MLEPLRQWKCDVCGETIENASEGYVVWGHDREGADAGFRIIHNGKCDDNSSPRSMALENLIGEAGLSRALAFISDGPLRTEKYGPTKRKVASIDSFVDLLRRLHVSYYEEARQYFGDVKLQDDLEDSTEAYPYYPDRLSLIAKHQGPFP